MSHFPLYGFDHATIRIVLEANLGESERKRKHIFRFEEAWSRDPRCEGRIHQLWNKCHMQVTNKCYVMQSLEERFKEYRVKAINQELRRIASRLKEKDG